MKKKNVKFITISILLVGAAILVLKNPLVFNESFFGHAHCILVAQFGLLNYANDNNGKFPSHENGYGDALLLLDPVYDYTFSGPRQNFDSISLLRNVKSNMPEMEVGRVYIQGLTLTNNTDIAILFDKLPTPGGDHCHFFKRLFSPLGREVLFLGGHVKFIKEIDWLEFETKQINLLIEEGFEFHEIRNYYDFPIGMIID